MGFELQNRLKILQSQIGLDASKEIAKAFIKEFQTTIPQLSQSLKQGASEQVSYYAHKLRGSLLNIGALRLSKLTTELERIAKLENNQFQNRKDRLVRLIEKGGSQYLHFLNGFLGGQKGTQNHDSSSHS